MLEMRRPALGLDREHESRLIKKWAIGALGLAQLQS
jgi:hypothetical protein